jgi:hypothetical protein
MLHETRLSAGTFSCISQQSQAVFFAVWLALAFVVTNSQSHENNV